MTGAPAVAAYAGTAGGLSMSVPFIPAVDLEKRTIAHPCGPKIPNGSSAQQTSQ
jgi:hypothetical protein